MAVASARLSRKICQKTVGTSIDGIEAGQEIQVDGVDYLIMKQNDILAII